MDDANIRGETPIMIATSLGDHRMIEALVRNGARALDEPDKIRKHTPFRASLGIHGDDHYRTMITLVTLGARTEETQRQFLNQPDSAQAMRLKRLKDVTEAEILAIRQRVYFVSSLTKMLLLELGAWIPIPG